MCRHSFALYHARLPLSGRSRPLNSFLSESYDDRPTNGLALTPNLHWAMDNRLIAPGPDHKWHVSPTLDDFMPDNAWLQQLHGQAVVLPRAKRWQPDQQALAWRMDHLLR
ncbi:HNH endonuclease [Halomonas sp. BC1]|uniref:HNH endonuclease n=1 Tax=Halomonas sp. BC1 TaxID=1670448 RepID=UPI00406D22BA